MKSDVYYDWNWSNQFIPDIKKILTKNAQIFLNIEIANAQDDMERATDFIVTVSSGQVAVRIRRDGYSNKYRDWTIRSFRSSGTKTELEKIRQGFASWYLYLWTTNNQIADWVLIDLNKVRSKGLLDIPRKQIPNKDKQTYFIAVPINEIKQNGCLIDEFQPNINYQAQLFRVY